MHIYPCKLWIIFIMQICIINPYALHPQIDATVDTVRTTQHVYIDTYTIRLRIT